MILDCPKTGALANALWLIYATPNHNLEFAKQACRLLKKSIQFTSHTSGSPGKALIDPFVIMSWHWLALDRVLSVVMGTLASSDDVTGVKHPDATNRTDIMTCLTSALRMLRQLSNPFMSACAIEQPQWIRKRVGLNRLPVLAYISLKMKM
ncbi:unnamed protein product [Echinostoma caproni]|uniref:Mediator of RNA polymerase II transcription subunit 33A n=1 Tax=Echinostoma caproni TaxID=27848 RepID=A0A183BEP7_9TREM|nr:unnamed protein product [Echinostoma caproni]